MWLIVAFVAAILEVSIPHFGSCVRQRRRHRRGGGRLPRFQRADADWHVRRRPDCVAGRTALDAGRAAGRPRRAVTDRRSHRPARCRHPRHRADDRRRARQRQRRGLGGAQRERHRRGHENPSRLGRRHRSGGHTAHEFRHRPTSASRSSLLVVADAHDQDRAAEAGQADRAPRQVPPDRGSRPQHHRAVPRFRARDHRPARADYARSNRSRSSPATTSRWKWTR